MNGILYTSWKDSLGVSHVDKPVATYENGKIYVAADGFFGTTRNGTLIGEYENGKVYSIGTGAFYYGKRLNLVAIIEDGKIYSIQRSIPGGVSKSLSVGECSCGKVYSHSHKLMEGSESFGLYNGDEEGAAAAAAIALFKLKSDVSAYYDNKPVQGSSSSDDDLWEKYGLLMPIVVTYRFFKYMFVAFRWLFKAVSCLISYITKVVQDKKEVRGSIAKDEKDYSKTSETQKNEDISTRNLEKTNETFDTDLVDARHQNTEKKEPENENLPTREKKKHTMKVKSLVICTLCLIVAVASILFVFNITKNDEDVISIHNEWNSNSVVCAEEYIFFTSHEGKIIRATKDNKEHISIVDDIKCFELNIWKDKLYYISEEDDFIYSCDFDGKNQERVLDQKTLWFDIYNGDIYYRDGYIEFQQNPFEIFERGNFNLYKCSLEGKKIKQITTCETVNIQFAGKDIIYWNADEEALYKTDLRGSNHTLIKDDMEYSRFILYNDKLYYSFVDYSENSGIYSYDIANGEKVKLVSTVTEKFTIWNDKLVYIADSNSSTAVAYVSTLEGKNSKKLFNNCMNNELAISNDWLYLVDEHVIRCVNSYNYELKFIPKVFVEKQMPEKTKGNTVKYESTDSMEYAIIEYNKDGYKIKESRYGKPENEKFYDTDVFYNSNNQISNIVDYDEKGIFSDWRMLYDEKGRLSEEFSYDENYKLNTYIVYNYRADGIAEKIFYDAEKFVPDGMVAEIEFDDAGREIKSTYYDGAKIEFYTFTEYGEDGKISKETRYSPDDEVLSVETYTIIE